MGADSFPSTTSCSHSAPLTSAGGGISLLCLQPAGWGLGVRTWSPPPNISLWISKTSPLRTRLWGWGWIWPSNPPQTSEWGQEGNPGDYCPPPPSPQLPPHPTPQTRKPNPASLQAAGGVELPGSRSYQHLEDDDPPLPTSGEHPATNQPAVLSFPGLDPNPPRRTEVCVLRWGSPGGYRRNLLSSSLPL